MCGISGIVSFKGNSEDANVRRMTDLITHRGPDDYGFLAYNSSTHLSYRYKESFNNVENTFNLFLGHRRLSIIDLSIAAKQPMSYLNERYWIVYNGEVYNYIEIRKELESKKYQFHSASDTEVILAAYAEWGSDCLNRFNGMWAFAILDTVKNTLLLARDRMGVKPLYYHFDGNYFSFSSEIKQLLSLPWVNSILNQSLFKDYVINNGSYGVGEETAFISIYELRGGHSILIDLNDSITSPVKLNLNKWWDINPNKKLSGLNDREYAERYYDLFYNACKIRLRSEVPVGTALSGGLDSSGVACIIDKVFKEDRITGRQKTFTLSSHYAEFDETNYAQEVLNNINGEPNFTFSDENLLLDDFDRLILHQEEPFPTASIFASYSIAKLTRDLGVIVSLDGQGADEILGGYFPYASVLASDLEEFRPYSFFSNLTGFHRNQGFSYLNQLRRTGGQLAPFIKNLYPNGSENPLKHLLSLDFISNMLPSPQKRVQSASNIHNRMDRYYYDMVKTFPLPDYLRVADRNTMAFSVESRLPFLDYRLVEFTFSLPNDQKIRNGITKFVYRNAMKGVLPEMIRNRHKKLGFVTPESIWFKLMLKDLFKETIQLKEYPEIFNYDAIEKLFSSFINNGAPYNPVFWKILYSIKWLRLFKTTI